MAYPAIAHTVLGANALTYRGRVLERCEEGRKGVREAEGVMELEGVREGEAQREGDLRAGRRSEGGTKGKSGSERLTELH